MASTGAPTPLQTTLIDPTHASANYLTSDQGVKVSDTDNWLKLSDGTQVGPLILEDQVAREKVMHFDHERIPERVVHARGTGAYGYFKVHDHRASKYTYAPVLTDPSRKTPVFVRFSTVQGSRGSADTVRDVRGFATKFYTQEGNWDLVGNDIPVFFIQESIKFPDFVHAVKPEPHNEVPQGQSAHNNFWDFVGLQPESAHMVMWVMSDRGIPRSFRMMQGFGVNTYTLHTLSGEQFFVKFHWIPELGVYSLFWDEALKISGQDPDFHRKDLYEAIENGALPKWKFCIQVIPASKEHDFDFDILDATKIWPEELVPLEEIGEMVLDRKPEEFFPEVEQVAFCTANVIPGIGFSDDPLLQGRNFSYFDTQLSRLGVNWQELPVNRPVCPVLNHQRDGQMRHRITSGTINYWPNRKEIFPPVPPKGGGYFSYPAKVEGTKQRIRGGKFQEHYNQPQLFYNSLAPFEKKHLVDAISFELDHCDDPVVYQTYTKVLKYIDFELAKKVAANVGSTIPDKPGRENLGKTSKPLSQLYYEPKEPTVVERRVAVLVADGFNLEEFKAVHNALSSAKAKIFIIGPHRGEVYPSGVDYTDGKGIRADHHFEGQRSTLFDAVYIPSGYHVAELAKNGRVVQYVREAFGHCKAIGAVGHAIAFLRDIVDLPGVEFQHEDSKEVKTSYGVVTIGKYEVETTAIDTLQIKPGSKDFATEFAYVISRHRCYEREMDGLTSQVAY
ncbi:catalase [Multifurca ochricompacta]|uniref:Catalase n=1 Tax=Multifurca ochricompacta TaxID=376703 RepID=A0AAD4MCN8_9AGAM|nr:catalase [Multifurca ochricompacta]